ncbi:hypothetical protein EXIGLDRAFT_767429 [Exidia glandulosa HHB12029]|uniref:Transcription initiation factor TFIID subunit 1 histone acetyltransferase domain-containing protein n=1 Tax=Exidia glandulosa HHB12029 TaxID=1314781 RepID=A0A165J0E5_EXIGL|nr:hypothetical protein EXIGLDRAFT_767429 [Exidia glandulosa HHB12029]
MAGNDESAAVSALTGLGIDSILAEMGMSTEGLDRVGLANRSALSTKQIYQDVSDEEEEAIGMDQGRDWEDEVDREIVREPHFTLPPLPGPSSRALQPPAPPRPVVAQPPRGEKRKKTIIVRREVEKPKTVYELYPAFERDRVLDFSELFKGFVVNKSRISKRPFTVETANARRRIQPNNFLKNVVGDARRQVEHKRVEQVVAASNVDEDLRRALQERSSVVKSKLLSNNDRSFDLVSLSNWEDQIIYEPDPESKPRTTDKPDQSAMRPLNAMLESGAWTQGIIWDAKAPFRDFTQFDYEDELLEADDNAQDAARPKKKTKTDGPPRDKFNMSNDHHYEMPKTGARTRVRQTFGQLVVHHAHPAQKLQLPFYKTRLTKSEMRSFHRPALQFPVNIELRFTRVRTAKKKKDKTGRTIAKGGDAGDVLHSTADLSLKDTSPFILLEYSEEHPPVMSNYGMGSILVNYYRKKSDTDDTVPKLDLGEPFLLEPQDESPFLKFGNVEPGKVIPALYNNLIRAPLFRHTAYPTDFLVIKSTSRGDTKYYIREIKNNIFVVGQTYPVTEVPGPHSRKITTTLKNRLQLIAYKLLRKSPGERLKISRLMKYFPDQNELQMRQRLKEFMEYHRRGPHQGFWRLKGNGQIPSEAEMLKMLTPEQVVLSESMQVGQRHLQDLGYGRGAEAEDGDESKLDIEQQLAPWITTKNFMNATQSKAMLKLHGAGDPTGRGEAFSFIRVSMKEIFVKAGEDYEAKMAEADNRPKSAHRYNVAEQQQIYKSEVDRIWKAQYDSLSRKDEPILSDDDDEPPVRGGGGRRVRFNSARPDGPSSYPTPSAPSPYAGSPTAMSPGRPSPSAPSSPAFSRGSSIERDMSLGPESGQKVLRIKRLVDGEWQTEIVRDSAVINAYLRRRQLLEDESTQADMLAPTGDADKDRRYKKRLAEELARMKKNQERRLHRKNAKIAMEGGTPLTLKRPMKPDTTRRCGHCGQMGHMKTNRKCPRWAEFNQPQPPGAPAPVPTPPVPRAGETPKPASSPAPHTAQSPVFMPSGLRAHSGSVSFQPAAPSPLAASPPVTGEDVPMTDSPMDMEPSTSAPAPKLKLILKRNG